MSCGNSRSSKCNPCGPSEAAMNEIANRAASYARQSNIYSVNAENSANNAQEIADQGIADITALIEQFGELYLGAKASDPTTDNQGNPLQVGALYWNTTTSLFKVWNGSSWTVVSNFNELTTFTATGTDFNRNLVTRFSDYLNVKDFGAVGDGVTDDTTNVLQAVAAACFAGKNLYFPKGNYKITQTIVITAPITIFGDGGNNYWNPTPVTASTNEIQASSTQIIFTGTGAKSYKYYGASNMQVSGGTSANPSARAGYNDSNYTMLNFMNGGTQRAFSTGILINSQGASIENMRVLADGGGSNGLTFYNTYRSDALGTNNWANGNSNWDFGILNNGSSDIKMLNVQVTGHWRMAGYFICANGLDLTDAKAPYRCYHENCIFQGYKGLSVRGSDSFECTDVQSSYVSVTYTANHPFTSELFPYISSETGSFTILGVTSTSVVGSELRLFCTNPTAAVVGQRIIARPAGGGTSHNNFSNCFFYGIHHPSGFMAHQSRVGSVGLTNAYPAPSSCMEISGWRISELTFDKLTLHSFEEVLLHFHDVTRVQIYDILLEHGVFSGITGDNRARLITSPNPTLNPRISTQASSTYLLTLQGPLEDIQDGIDLRPYIPNTTNNQYALNPSDPGMLNANGLIIPNYTHYSRMDVGGNGAYLRAGNGTLAGIKGAGYPGGANKLYYDDANGKVFSDVSFNITTVPYIASAWIWNGSTFSEVTVNTGRQIDVTVAAGRVLELRLNLPTNFCSVTIASNLSSGPKAVLFMRPTTSSSYNQIYGTAINSSLFSAVNNIDLTSTTPTAGKTEVSAVQLTRTVTTSCIQIANNDGVSSGYSIVLN